MPPLFEIDDFDTKTCTEEELINKSNQLIDEIQEVKNHRKELEERLESVEKGGSKFEKVIIHIGDATVNDPQVGKKYQICLIQNMNSLIWDQKETPKNSSPKFTKLDIRNLLESSITVNIDKTQKPWTFTIKPPSPIQEEHKVTPEEIFKNQSLPVSKVTSLNNT